MSSMQLSPEPPPMATERYRPARNHFAGVVTCGNGSIATPHGTAAALKAEAPQPDPHWLRAAMSESFGLDQCVDHHDYMAELRESQRRARKAANRRKARRGWR